MKAWLQVIIFVVVIALVYLLVQTVGRHHSSVDGGGTFRLKISDPEYTAMLSGKKTVDARPDRMPFSKLSAGDQIMVVRSRPKDDTSEYPGGKYKFMAEITKVKKYGDIEKLLKAEGVDKVYPGRTHIDAVKQFKQYLPAEVTINDPVIAFELRAVAEGVGAAKKPKSKGASSYDPYGMNSYDPYSMNSYESESSSESAYNPYGIQSYQPSDDTELDITSYMR